MNSKAKRKAKRRRKARARRKAFKRRSIGVNSLADNIAEYLRWRIEKPSSLRSIFTWVCDEEVPKEEPNV
jgi:hypothetical protein